MLARKKGIGIKTKVAAGLLAITTVTCLSAPAKAFNIMQTIASSLGYGDLYESASGLYNSASELMTEINGLATGIGSANSTGVLGMIDLNALGQEALDAYNANPTDPNDNNDLSSRFGRVKAAIAEKMGSSILTKKGQEKTEEQLEQQNNYAEAASNAIDTAMAADNSLEVAQQNSIAIGSLVRQNQSLATMTVQGNQIGAANVTIQKANNQELAKINNNLDEAKESNKATIRNLANFPMPGFADIP
jgi:hypothetical protein